jgi:hypothetical protein
MLVSIRGLSVSPFLLRHVDAYFYRTRTVFFCFVFVFVAGNTDVFNSIITHAPSRCLFITMIKLHWTYKTGDL